MQTVEEEEKPRETARARSALRWEKATAIRVRTLVIALCALGASMWQGYSIQRHNKLSVQPYLQPEVNFNAKDGTWNAYIVNNGLGPAKVTRADFYADGKAVKNLPALLEALGEPVRCHGTGNIARFYRVNDRQQVTVVAEAQCGKTPETLDQLTARMRIVLHYESLYGEEFSVEIFGPRG